MLIFIQRYFFASLSLSTKINVIIVSKKFLVIFIIEDRDFVLTNKLDCLIINNNNLVCKS